MTFRTIAFLSYVFSMLNHADHGGGGVVPHTLL